jgi:hypothetical protein
MKKRNEFMSMEHVALAVTWGTEELTGECRKLDIEGLRVFVLSKKLLIL